MRRGPSHLFPSPSTFAALLKTFQQALVPSRVPHVVGGGAASAATAAFAATVVPRRARSLADAVDAAAARVLSRLNGLEYDGPITLALLTVSPAYGSAATAAPAVLASALGCRVVIGGVSDGPGVTLWAARLPGMTATPFVSYGGSLPSLDNEAWAKLASGGDGTSTGALILGCSPSVGTLAGRLSVALPPAAAIVGGVLGHATPTTPLFINDGVAPADAAAVGVLLRGQGVRVFSARDGDKRGAIVGGRTPASSILLGPSGGDAAARVAQGLLSHPPPSPPSIIVDCDAVTVAGTPAGAGALWFSCA